MMWDSGIEKGNQMVKDERHTINLASTINLLFLPPNPPPTLPQPEEKIAGKAYSIRTTPISTYFVPHG